MLPADVLRPELPTAAASPRRRSASLAAWLAGVSLLALLPLLAFTAYTVYLAAEELQAQALAALQRRAASSAAAIGHEVEGVFASLRALAQADEVRRGDLAATHGLAVRVAQADPRIENISIVDAGGRQPFITTRPFGEPLPDSRAMALQQQLFERGERLLSPLVVGAVSRKPVVGLAMPIDMGPAGKFALRAVIRLEAIGARLNEQDWPEGWLAAVLDQNRVIVARSRDAARYIGQPATESLLDGLRGGRPLFESRTKDGQAVFTSVAAVPGWDWIVVVGRPAAALNAQVRDSMAALALAGALCATLAIVGALYLARRLGRQLRATVDAHLRGEPVALGTLREVAELSDALSRARDAESRAMQELQHAREQTLAQLRERSDMLDVLAHEVRQPLNNASAALQAATVELSRDGKLTAAEPLRRAEIVLSEVQGSIGNTLAMASLLVGGQRIEGVDTDIDALIEVAIADMPPSEVWRVRVERETNTRTATMEPGLMRLALRNLLSNALRCSPPGADVIVRVSDSDEPLALILDVIDRGPGIAADRLDHLSGAMPPRAARDARGRRRGLGLHIVHRVMELHGGSLRIERTGPEGTTMRLVINQFSDA
ncbi:MAG: sensor histidine kinase [Piscinibacter sp.]